MCITYWSYMNIYIEHLRLPIFRGWCNTNLKIYKHDSHSTLNPFALPTCSFEVCQTLGRWLWCWHCECSHDYFSVFLALIPCFQSSCCLSLGIGASIWPHLRLVFSFLCQDTPSFLQSLPVKFCLSFNVCFNFGLSHKAIQMPYSQNPCSRSLLSACPSLELI